MSALPLLAAAEEEGAEDFSSPWGLAAAADDDVGRTGFGGWGGIPYIIWCRPPSS